MFSTGGENKNLQIAKEMQTTRDFENRSDRISGYESGLLNLTVIVRNESDSYDTKGKGYSRTFGLPEGNVHLVYEV